MAGPNGLIEGELQRARAHTGPSVTQSPVDDLCALTSSASDSDRIRANKCAHLHSLGLRRPARIARYGHVAKHPPDPLTGSWTQACAEQRGVQERQTLGEADSIETDSIFRLGGFDEFDVPPPPEYFPAPSQHGDSASVIPLTRHGYRVVPTQPLKNFNWIPPCAPWGADASAGSFR